METDYRYDRIWKLLLPNAPEAEKGDTALALQACGVQLNSAQAVEIIAARHVEHVVSKLPQVIKAAAREAVGDTRATADSIVTAAKATLATSEAEVIRHVVETIATESAAAMAKTARIAERRSIAQNAAAWLLVGTVAMGTGWHLGAGSVVAEEGSLAAAAGQDAAYWTPLVRANSIKQAIAADCRGRFEGCRVKLGYDRKDEAAAAVNGMASDGFLSQLLPLLDWFNNFPGYQVAFGALLLGLQGRRLARGLGRFAALWPPLRFLLGD